jgi:TonB-dependent receptor
LGNLNFNNAASFTRQDRLGDYIPANFSANERITAGYAMWTQNFSQKFDLLTGLRLEQTRIEYTGATYDITKNTSTNSNNSDSYLNFLPSILTKYTVNDNTVLKASVTTSVARPNYYDIVPFKLISRDAKTIEIGNPALEATKAVNADLSLEKYLPKVGIVSGSIFYKNITDFIFTQTTNVAFEGENFQQFQRVNGAKAQVYGVEVAFQRQLTFLPSFLKYLGIYSNYSYTGSSVDNPDFTNINTLPGAPKHILNASLAFDNKRFMARVAFNYTSEFLDSEETILTPGIERYYDEVYYLDANASFVINKNFRIFAEANNLLNQPLRYFAGTRERTNQTEFYGSRFQFGLKYDLTK